MRHKPAKHSRVELLPSNIYGTAMTSKRYPRELCKPDRGLRAEKDQELDGPVHSRLLLRLIIGLTCVRTKLGLYCGSPIR